jgi:ribonuclease-3
LISLDYHFKNPDLLSLALTHKSSGPSNNERLEFLGDSLLNFIIAEALFLKFGHASEGQMSRLRASMVDQKSLAAIGRELSLPPRLVLGAGEKNSGGAEKDSVIADAVEAIIAAVFLDGGLEACRNQVLAWYESRLGVCSLDDVVKDAKSRLQEYCQSNGIVLPLYEKIASHGKDHERQYQVSCVVKGLTGNFTGSGSSIRNAEQDAAAAVLAQIELET